MGDVATGTVIVLWESELRAAAKTLNAIFAELKGGKDTAKLDVLACDAINACAVALEGIIENPEAQMVVSSAERWKFGTRVTTVNPHKAKEGT
jgi:hypothetical protein